MTSNEKALYRRVDEILHYLWDPIGVKEAQLARDEYHHYVPGVCALLLRGADHRKVTDHLIEIERSTIGLAPDVENTALVAKILLQAKDALVGD